MNPLIIKVMNPLIIKVMRPPTWGKTDFVPFWRCCAAAEGHVGSKVMNPFITEVMSPPPGVYWGHSRRQFSDLAFRGSGKKSRFSSSDDGFEEGFDDPSPSWWSTWTPPRSNVSEANGKPSGPLPNRVPPVIAWLSANRWSPVSR